MIKNIVFDLGNVLVRFAPTQFITRFTENPEYQKLLLNELFFSAEWIQYDRGTLKEEELGRKVCAKLPTELHETALEIIDKWHEELQPIKEMEQVVLDLKNQGYRIYLLSNAPGVYYEYQQNIPVLSYFDGVFISADWKLIKPEAGIYRAFCSHFQVVPAQCFFVDDLPLNIEGAWNAGMKGCVFKDDIAGLKRNFERAGILL